MIYMQRSKAPKPIENHLCYALGTLHSPLPNCSSCCGVSVSAMNWLTNVITIFCRVVSTREIKQPIIFNTFLFKPILHFMFY